MDSGEDGKPKKPSEQQAGDGRGAGSEQPATVAAKRGVRDEPTAWARPGTEPTTAESPRGRVAEAHASTLHAAGKGEADAPAEPSTDDAAHPSWSAVRSLNADDRYTVRKELGRGGMGRVLLAKDQLIERDVAFKEIIVEDNESMSPADKRRFLREARLSGRLGHPSIVPIYDLGELPDGKLYYTMRFVEGQGFDAALNECESLEERLRYLPNFRDLCNAVAFAHSRQIIHRDLKPANIIVGAFGETMVVDWGLAKFLDEDDPIDDATLFPRTEASMLKTRAGIVMGTPPYMPPEQASGEIKRVDAKSDQYSLGAILYEVLTGRPPFLGQTSHEVMDRVISEPLVSVVEREPDAPKELAVIAEKALAKVPADRFDSAKDMADEISAYLSGEKLASYTYTTRELFSRFVQRHKMAVVAAAVALVALIATAVITSVAWRQATDARNVAVAAQRHAKRAEAQERLQRQRAEKALAAMAQKQRVAHFNLARALATKAEQSIRDKLPLDALVYAAAARLHNPVHPQSPWHHPGFATQDPSARMVLARAQGTYLLARASTAMVYRRRIHASRHNLRFFGGVWRYADRHIPVSFQKQWVLSHTNSPDARLYDLRSGRLLRTLKGHKKSITHAAFSARGETLLTVDKGGGARVWRPSTGALMHTLQLPYRRSRSDYTLRAVATTSSFVWVRRRGPITVLTPGPAKVARVDVPQPTRLLSECMHPRLPLLYTIGVDGKLRVVHLPDGRRQTVHTLPGARWVQCRFSLDGRLLTVSERYKKRISLFGVSPTGDRLQLRSSHTGIAARAIAIPGSRPWRLWLGRGMYDFSLYSIEGSMKLYQAWSPSLTRYALLEVGPTGALLFQRHGGGLHQWKAVEVSRRTYPAIGSRIQVAVPSPTSNGVVVSTWDGHLRIYDEKSDRWVALGKRFMAHPWSVDWSPDGRYIAAADGDEAARVYDAQSHKLLCTLDVVTTKTPTIVFSADSSVVHVYTSRFLYAFSMPSGTLLAKVKADGRTHINGGTPAPSRRHVLVNDLRKRYLHSFATGKRKQLPLLSGRYKEVVQCMAARGGVLACQEEDHDIHLWRYPSLDKLMVLRGFDHSLASICPHPDGKHVLTSVDDSTITLWEMSTGRPLLRIGDVNSQFVQLSKDGRTLYFSRKSVLMSMPLDLAPLRLSPQKLLEQSQRFSGLCIDGVQLKSLADCRQK